METRCGHELLFRPSNLHEDEVQMTNAERLDTLRAQAYILEAVIGTIENHFPTSQTQTVQFRRADVMSIVGQLKGISQ